MEIHDRVFLASHVGNNYREKPVKFITCPAWRGGRMKRTRVIIGFFSVALPYCPLAFRKGGQFAQSNKDSDCPLECTTSFKLLFY